MSRVWRMPDLCLHTLAGSIIDGVLCTSLIGGVMEDGKKLNTELGTVQGGLISPVLANVYLHYVLDTWFVHISEREYSGEMYMVRYEAEQETGGTLSILRDIWKLDQHCMAQSIPHQRLLKRK